MKWIAMVLGTLFALGFAGWLMVRQIQGEDPVEGVSEVSFSEIDFPFAHQTPKAVSLPFMGLAAVDIDGDGVDEVFVGNGRGFADGLLRFTGTSFERDNTASASLFKAQTDATMGAASIDTDGDGLEELFVARESGVYFCQNMGAGVFEQHRLQFGIDAKTVPLSIALGDINRDGKVDLYISGYLELSATEGETNFSDHYGGYSYLLINNGDNTWRDISRQAGVRRQHNTFVAVFVELDNDGWVDLVVAEDTGVVETWRNNGDTSFTRMPNPTVSSYPMGIGAGDINNDGLIDLYFSNVGTTLPRQLLRGNLARDAPFNMDYMLLLNQGAFRFTDVARERSAARYGFGWGTSIADFNNDGRMDLYFAQNYVRFPGVKLLELYPGRLLEQQSDGSFLSVERSAGLTNRNFGITQIVTDFNRDAQLDIVLANLEGPARAFLSLGGGGRGLLVSLPSEPVWLNSRVRVTTDTGKTLTRQLVASTGLGSDGMDTLHFGLGDSVSVAEVVVERPDGWKQTYPDVGAARVLKVELGDR